MRILLFLLLLALPAQASAQAVEVDLELVLAVDVSRSMSPAELELQRRGYAEALTSPEVAKALRSGMLGRVAITYVEWAQRSRVVVPWTLVENENDAAAIAAELTAVFDAGMRRTSISRALTQAAASFEGNGFIGLRRVIDISGDGPNNLGSPVLEARAAVLGKGIVINGLPLMTEDALSSMWGIPDLDVYYAECVVGGPASFVLPVKNWDAFPAAVRRKLVMEIAGMPAPTPRVIRAQQPASYDCLVGERMWEQNRAFFDIP